LRSTCALLRDDPGFELLVFVGGMHCSSQFGQTSRLIAEEGFTASASLRWLPESGEMPATDQAAAAMVLVADALRRHHADALLLVGDRLETAAAALAATLECVPLIHLHGGEESEGAIDNALRHATTKLSHLHFVSHPDHAARVVQMGEDPKAVHLVGAPGLDNLHRPDLATRQEIETFLGLILQPPVVLVTLHPTTLAADAGAEVEAVCGAMRDVPATYVITLPNADPGNALIRQAFTRLPPRGVAVEALGDRRYWGLMRLADAMLGNSSSALIEAPALGLPTVNVGDRQRGRVRGGNVIDMPARRGHVAEALRRALTPEFHDLARAAPSPFGNGDSGRRIVEVLRCWQPPSPPVKRFHGVGP
jgi:UDP-hydrolysing UDP-N-acetyl-D-glucosamine 2-epimerase